MTVRKKLNRRVFLQNLGLSTAGFALIPNLAEPDKRLLHKTITLLGTDAANAGAFHEYYDPDSGKPIMNKGFQNWNYLAMNMIVWLQGKPVVEEF